MDLSWIGEAIKVLLIAVLGIVGKVIYDHRFAKKPDLRYSFGAPAAFGTGERERVYQNLEVSNVGTESTTDVRINFSLPGFDLIEHQVAYDGVHNLERNQDRATIVVPSLPPSDSLTLSFVLSPSKTNAQIRDIYLSARSKECLAKPLDRAKGANYDYGWGVFGLGIILGLITIIVYVLTERSKIIELFKEQPTLREKLETAKIKIEVARLSVQAANPATLGKEVAIKSYIENLSEHPFAGTLVIYPPRGWAGAGQAVVSTDINLGGLSRKVFNLSVRVPNGAQPGKYQFTTELTGAAFDEPVRVWTKSVLEVKP
jgi:hypothetical protein